MTAKFTFIVAWNMCERLRVLRVAKLSHVIPVICLLLRRTMRLPPQIRWALGVGS